MTKTTPKKKEQPVKVEALRETIAKTKVTETTEKTETPKRDVKVETEEVVLETMAEEPVKKVEKKHEPKIKKPSANVDVDDLTGALEDHKTRKKPLMTAVIALLTVLVVVGLTFWFLYQNAGRHNEQDENDQPDNSQVESELQDPNEVTVIEEVDYAQDIVGANGVALDPVYYLGTKDNFTLKFTKLNCDETCSNIEEVKLNGKTLTQGVDYIVKREDGVTLVVYAATLNRYEAGDAELTFQILQDKDSHKELRTVGVKFEIKKAIVCGANQIVQNGKCVDKPQETTPDNNKPANTPQAICEAQEGPDYVYQVHWYTEEERQAVIRDYGYDEGVIVSVVRSDFVGDKSGSSSASMKWIDGKCRPNPNATAVTAGEKSYTDANLSTIDGNFAAIVRSNPQSDILVYAWRTDTGRIEYVMEYII